MSADVPAADPVTTMPGQRQCGRCRTWFPWDGATNPNATAEWWLCAPCNGQLLHPAITTAVR